MTENRTLGRWGAGRIGGTGMGAKTAMMNPLEAKAKAPTGEDPLVILLAALREREDRLLDIEEVKFRTTLSRSRIHVLECEGRFPRRRQISGNKVGWLASEIATWIAGRPRAGGGTGG